MAPWIALTHFYHRMRSCLRRVPVHETNEKSRKQTILCNIRVTFGRFALMAGRGRARALVLTAYLSEKAGKEFLELNAHLQESVQNDSLFGYDTSISTVLRSGPIQCRAYLDLRL